MLMLAKDDIPKEPIKPGRLLKENKTLITKDFVIHKHVKTSDLNRRFGVFMTPLSR